MARIPYRYAPLLYSAIQAALTTAIATGIATFQTTTLGLRFLGQWLSAWGLAWLAILPVVMLAAPLIQRSVLILTDLPPHPSKSKPDRK
jgi:hypothetical protein